MKRVAVSQRVECVPQYGERRDSLDQRWFEFLARADIIAIPVANNPSLLVRFLDGISFDGVLLTGGGDLSEYGGDTPERDATEYALIKFAVENQLPLIGVCRGMQALQNFFGVPLHAVTGHVASEQTIIVDGVRQSVNSYHCLGTTQTVPDLEVRAVAEDGIIEAVRHRKHPIFGMMWHPERLRPFRAVDIEFFKQTYSSIGQ